eukprot:CAMPEP_0198503106 /NCGR_PEP_ID=MMETSP1462-20131121/9703_1 /TAXON_ID=1333877 /ORGANISM="Brandtodinium nutriculum, Strain RCC3387" /LENGTH=511 /DNA_ID=CAMNT_0044232213 /DNA_START=124 /DNA_END=1656 /DNA_ORIENTATION=+
MACVAGRLLAVCVGLCVASGAPTQWSAYRLMVDAGSSGSRLHIYKWEGDGTGRLTAVEPSISDKHALKTEPGLSSFAETLDGAGMSLAPLLQVANKYVPAGARPSTPLWIKATAGLRVLDTPVIDALIQSVSAYLRNSTNCAFAFQTMEAVSGESEGVYGFLAVNDLLGNRRPFVGILDLGGASTQLTFVPKGAIKLNEFAVYMPSRNKGWVRSQSLFVDSYTKFGVQEFQMRIRKSLARAKPTADQVNNPCMFSGDTQRVELPSGRKVEFVGTSDPEACEHIVQNLLHTDYACVLEPCAVMGRYVAEMPDKLYAIGAFFYTAYNLGLVGSDCEGQEIAVTPAHIANATYNTCSMTMEQVRRHNPQLPLRHLRRLCMAGTYTYSLLRAYGFHPEDTNVTFAHKVGGQSLDWTRGAVLFEEYMPNLAPRSDDLGEGIVGAALQGMVAPSQGAGLPWTAIVPSGALLVACAAFRPLSALLARVRTRYDACLIRQDAAQGTYLPSPPSRALVLD